MLISWQIVNPNTTAPVTGGAASTAVKIRRAADGYLFDFNDSTFKAAGWSSVSSAMAEASAVNLPGVYTLTVDTAAWNDGVYQVFGAYTGTPALYSEWETRIEDGIEAVVAGTVSDKTGYALTAGEHTLISGTDVPAALTAQGYTTTRAGYLDTLNGLVTNIWAAGTRTLTAFGFGVTVATNNDKTGYTLTSGDKNTLVDLVWDETLTGATHNVATSAGRRLRQIASNIIIDGTAQGAGTGSNQIQLANDASSTNGAYDPGLVYIVAGSGAGQSRIILQYDGATRTATVNRDWKTAVDATSEYIVAAYADLQCVNEGLIRSATSNTAKLNANAQTHDDAYVGQILFLVSGTGQDQAGLVLDYDGASQTATISGTWAVTPDATTGYIMIPASPVLLDAVTRAQLTTIQERTDNLPDNPAATGDAMTLTAGEHTLITISDVPTALTAQGYTTTRAGYLDTLNGLVANIWSYATRTLTAFGFDVTLTSAYDAAKTAATQASVDTIDGKADDIIEDIYYLTHNEAGEPIVRVIPPPETSGTCVLYEYCYNVASAQPLESVTATAQIRALPYNSDGKLHTGAVIAGTYDSTTGIVYWEIVQGATVMVTIKEVGILDLVTIPAELQARVYDLR